MAKKRVLPVNLEQFLQFIDQDVWLMIATRYLNYRDLLLLERSLPSMTNLVTLAFEESTVFDGAAGGDDVAQAAAALFRYSGKLRVIKNFHRLLNYVESTPNAEDFYQRLASQFPAIESFGDDFSSYQFLALYSQKLEAHSCRLTTLQFNYAKDMPFIQQLVAKCDNVKCVEINSFFNDSIADVLLDSQVKHPIEVVTVNKHQIINNFNRLAFATELIVGIVNCVKIVNVNLRYIERELFFRTQQLLRQLNELPQIEQLNISLFTHQMDLLRPVKKSLVRQLELIAEQPLYYRSYVREFVEHDDIETALDCAHVEQISVQNGVDSMFSLLINSDNFPKLRRLRLRNVERGCYFEELVATRQLVVADY